jgi:hypothetical protein
LAQTIHVPDDTGPYDVSLSVGRFPFDWDLYDYVKSGAGWSKQKLASGSNLTLVRLLPAARADLAGHTLVWSLTLIDLDDQARTTDATVTLIGPSKKPTTMTVSFEAALERPHIFVTVEVVP